MPVLRGQLLAAQTLGDGHGVTAEDSRRQSCNGTAESASAPGSSSSVLGDQVARRGEIVRPADGDEAGEHVVVIEERGAHVVVLGRAAEHRAAATQADVLEECPIPERPEEVRQHGERSLSGLHDPPATCAPCARATSQCSILTRRPCRTLSNAATSPIACTSGALARRLAETAMPPSASSRSASAASCVLGLTPAPTTTRSTSTS